DGTPDAVVPGPRNARPHHRRQRVALAGHAEGRVHAGGLNLRATMTLDTSAPAAASSCRRHGAQSGEMSTGSPPDCATNQVATRSNGSWTCDGALFLHLGAVLKHLHLLQCNETARH